jgi:hypothetical protein
MLRFDPHYCQSKHEVIQLANANAECTIGDEARLPRKELGGNLGQRRGRSGLRLPFLFWCSTTRRALLLLLLCCAR